MKCHVPAYASAALNPCDNFRQLNLFGQQMSLDVNWCQWHIPTCSNERRSKHLRGHQKHYQSRPVWHFDLAFLASFPLSSADWLRSMCHVVQLCNCQWGLLYWSADTRMYCFWHSTFGPCWISWIAGRNHAEGYCLSTCSWLGKLTWKWVSSPFRVVLLLFGLVPSALLLAAVFPPPVFCVPRPLDASPPATSASRHFGDFGVHMCPFMSRRGPVSLAVSQTMIWRAHPKQGPSEKRWDSKAVRQHDTIWHNPYDTTMKNSMCLLRCTLSTFVN